MRHSCRRMSLPELNRQRVVRVTARIESPSIITKAFMRTGCGSVIRIGSIPTPGRISAGNCTRTRSPGCSTSVVPGTSGEP